MLDMENSQPLYQQLRDKLHDDIEKGVYKKGGRIPTEMELSDEYKVSRITVRKALKDLAEDGLLERRKGKGTYVSSVKLQRSISNFIGFSDSCQAQGIAPGYKVLKSVIEDANEADREELHLDAPDSRVVVLERILYADGVPVAYDINRFTEEYLFLLDEDLNRSLYAVLREKYSIIFHSNQKILELDFANYEMSQYLAIPAKYPLLKISSIVSNQDRKLACRTEQYIAGDKFKFYI